MNDLTFNEQAFYDKLTTAILKGFKTDTSRESKYWYKLFGNRQIRVYDSLAQSEPQFPCCVITVESIPNRSLINSSQIDRFSNVSIEIEHYNQSVGGKSKEVIGREINTRLREIIQQEFGAIIVNNSQIRSPYEQVYRRLISIAFTYDNLNNIIYKGGY